MPKSKTKKSLVKKVRVTKKGKVVRGRAFTAHLKSKKSASRRARGKQQKIQEVSVAPWNNLIG
ncbi:MAG: 50S ribosomal protein L35 [Candidatus Dojkabacteria bacterium]|nr:MAG: 50S ribosomal protein L35 [Candidatus Dojkabacteria bacterium]